MVLASLDVPDQGPADAKPIHVRQAFAQGRKVSFALGRFAEHAIDVKQLGKISAHQVLLCKDYFSFSARKSYASRPLIECLPSK